MRKNSECTYEYQPPRYKLHRAPHMFAVVVLVIKRLGPLARIVLLLPKERSVLTCEHILLGVSYAPQIKIVAFYSVSF
jgi:hypothetical protein